jgi:hypothetical protein
VGTGAFSDRQLKLTGLAPEWKDARIPPQEWRLEKAMRH